MNKLIGYCGLDCEKCDTYIATKNNDDELRKKTAELWSKMNNTTITPEMINCEGCRTSGIKCYFCDAMCEIKKCAVGKNFETCADCKDLDSCKTITFITAHRPDALENLKNNK